MKAKYIMYYDRSFGDMPVIFPQVIPHIVVDDKINLLPKSAGFVDTVTLECSGKSIGLNLISYPNDTEIMQEKFARESY